MTKAQLSFVFFLSLLVACSSAKEGNSSQQSPLPGDFFIEVGEGGGFTGLWQGYSVDSTGAVQELSGRTLGAARAPVGTLSADSLRSLWRHITESGILSEAPSLAAGNMTRTLTITAHGATTRYSWPKSLSPERSTARLDDLYTYIVAMITRTVHK